MNKREMTVDYLRDHCHLRTRTDSMAAVVRLRDSTMRTMQDYFTVRVTSPCQCTRNSVAWSEPRLHVCAHATDSVKRLRRGRRDLPGPGALGGDIYLLRYAGIFHLRCDAGR